MSSLGLFLKNISSLADDMTSLVKISTKNTLTVVGDDIAASSENFSELQNSRELPVIVKVAKGAILNKIILVPIILVVSYFLPWIIPYILLFASFYLAYEGVESFLELFKNKEENKNKENVSEKEQIKESIKIDFILSLEIVLITLASVENAPFLKQALVVSIVSILMVFVIYGTVLFIVKIDDIGYYIYKQGVKTNKKTLIKTGKRIIKAMSYLLKVLPYIGLYAVLYVGVEIFVHNIEKIIHSVEHLVKLIQENGIISLLGYPVISLIVGICIFGIVEGIKRIIK